MAGEAGSLTLHPYASYWDRGESNVPDMTGAKHLLDGRDLEAVFRALGIESDRAILAHIVDVDAAADAGAMHGGQHRFAAALDGRQGVLQLEDQAAQLFAWQ